MEPETDIVRFVYNEDGKFITVRPWEEGPTFVCIETQGDENTTWFGEFNVAMTPKFAEELGKALIECSREVLLK